MIDRHQSHLIEVNGFFQRFHETKTESRVPRRCCCGICSDRAGILIVSLSDHLAVDLYELNWPRNVALARPNPVTDHAGTQHIGDKLVALTVPYKERRTGTAAPVDLKKILLLVASYMNFVFEHSRRPEHAHDVGIFRISEADDDIGGILSQITV